MKLPNLDDVITDIRNVTTMRALTALGILAALHVADRYLTVLEKRRPLMTLQCEYDCKKAETCTASTSFGESTTCEAYDLKSWDEE